MLDSRPGLFGTVGTRLFGEEANRVYECRACGTTVGPDADACPECGGEQIVEFEID